MKLDIIKKYNYKKLLERVDLNTFFSDICFLSEPHIDKKVEYCDSKLLKLLINIRKEDGLANMTIVVKNYDTDDQDFSDFRETLINSVLLEIDECFPALNPLYVEDKMCVEYNEYNKCDNFIIDFVLDMPTKSVICNINFLFKRG